MYLDENAHYGNIVSFKADVFPIVALNMLDAATTKERRPHNFETSHSVQVLLSF